MFRSSQIKKPPGLGGFVFCFFLKLLERRHSCLRRCSISVYISESRAAFLVIPEHERGDPYSLEILKVLVPLSKLGIWEYFLLSSVRANQWHQRHQR
jgi:hypothetical protein